MNFVIVSHAPHKEQGEQLYAYEPYIREMNLWIRHVDKVTILAPMLKETVTPIEATYKHDTLQMLKVASIQFTSSKHSIRSIIALPKLLAAIFKAFKTADHIHLRCPGNLGALGCLVQICFPKIPKTAKYAGNWDPKAQQPLSYRFQKWILSNTFLTKNMTALVYGKWEAQSKNIKPFFTASFRSKDKLPYRTKNYKSKLKFVFTGSLVKGKRPGLVIAIVQGLLEQGIDVSLELYGEGPLRSDLENCVLKHDLGAYITFKGNQPLDKIKVALQESHFLVLPSKSEGWPKAVAEAMFYGVIPIATPVSCVANMLDHGRRGILIAPNIKAAVDQIITTLQSEDLNKMSKLAQEWSQKYTLEYFETEIKKIVKG